MKINLKNTEQISAKIEEAERKCKARCLDLDRLLDAAILAEKKLDNLNIPKAARKDCIVKLVPERVSNSYRGIPYGTFATIQRGSNDWFLVYVYRQTSGNQSKGRGEREYLVLSEQARAALPTSYQL